MSPPPTPPDPPPPTAVALPGRASAGAPGDGPASGPGEPPSGVDEDRRQRVLEALREVVDPELGLDIVAMGLVYDVRLVGEAVEVDMTLTTPGCPVAESLPAEAAEALRLALPHHAVEVRMVWDPPWTPERLAPEALDRLGSGR